MSKNWYKNAILQVVENFCPILEGLLVEIKQFTPSIFKTFTMYIVDQRGKSHLAGNEKFLFFIKF